jgi:hypothetical protein
MLAAWLLHSGAAAAAPGRTPCAVEPDLAAKHHALVAAGTQRLHDLEIAHRDGAYVPRARVVGVGGGLTALVGGSLDVGVAHLDDGRQRRRYLVGAVTAHLPSVNAMAHAGVMGAEYLAPAGTALERILPGDAGGHAVGAGIGGAVSLDLIHATGPGGQTVGVKGRLGIGIGMHASWARHFAGKFAVGAAKPSRRPAQLARAIDLARRSLESLRKAGPSADPQVEQHRLALQDALWRGEAAVGATAREATMIEVGALPPPRPVSPAATQASR